MKYDITDMAILMIVKFDSIDRLENTLVVIDYILENFKTNLYVSEIGTFNNGIFRRVMDKKIHYEFHQDYDPILHRTKYINQMVKKTKEEYVAIWDVDIIVPAEQISQAVNMLRNGADFVYPYERYFYDTSFAIRNAFYRTRDISLLDSYKPFMNEMYSPKPVGGIYMANKNTYIKSGLEEELFYGWGVEDGERYNRWNSQNRNIKRIKGAVYHLSHSRGINSFIYTDCDRIIKKRLLYATKRGI